jgi:1,2-diacylglycerol 3-alpha-glucosyltransferase
VTSLDMVLDQDVIFTGALASESLVNAYYSADLFVFSSLTETQGLVLIEAMAAGLPVVAVRASGVQEMVEHGVDGLLTANDTSALATAICQVLNNKKLYRTLQINARKKAEKLSCRNMALKLEKVYEELLTGNTYGSRNTISVNSWV